MRLLIVIGAVAALAACSGPREVTESPPGVSYRVTNNNVTEANQRAARYCQQYGKNAVFGGVNQSSGDSIAVYTCQ
ncbi:MAG: hypothetical protein JO010_03525 [Alphaproteobacteria bacterium]|nr:hypothetical protein [Alphaproteobacteria bacterium]